MPEPMLRLRGVHKKYSVGHNELHVLKGSTQLLQQPPPIVAEFWPQGLLSSGTSKDDFSQFIATYFDSFFDLSHEAPRKKSTKELPALFETYTGENFTDLLLLRSPTGRL